ncbi:beta-lactamase domain-containing protein [Catenovulum agarivorans DS-2]|uniref:Beta-lactamase domain-containing protein n=1 Tax=Catenovulum agarivorans DS-2 TaxID=1328313 RepID=W7QRV5_9ALTE|nr:MBL fold metallo-hydrolase [Catenovulum agarivorans]EWH11747.1 beta-lactamase domain-containing protein [Catenovulum agarivorans DS-2]
MSAVVKPFFHQASSTLCYVVYCEQTKHAAIIDPAYDFDYASGNIATEFSQQIIQFVESAQLKIKWILETHAHAEHLTAAQYLKRKLGGQIAIGAGITKVQSTFKHILNLADYQDIHGQDFDVLLSAGEQIDLGKQAIKIFASPGHTNDSISYLIDGNLFVGDTLFMPDAGTARCDFPGGSATRLYETVQQFYQLPDDTNVWVCHDYQPNGRELQYVATIAQHKQHNIHINAQTSVSEFVAKRESRDATLGMPQLIYPSIQINIRAGKMPPAEQNSTSYIKVPMKLTNQ